MSSELTPSKKQRTNHSNMSQNNQDCIMDIEDNAQSLMHNKTNGNSYEIDESLYSRQLYVLGKEAMTKMAHSNVLICGLDGLGLEVAKNIILSGVKRVTLFDNRSPTIWDLSSSYYLREEDVDSNLGLAELMQSRLAELNPYVDVNVLQSQDVGSCLPPIEDAIAYHVIVLCNMGCATPNLLSWTDAVRKCCKIVLVQSCGLFGQLFVDFGDEFIVQDKTGEEPLHVLVQAIEHSKDGLITCLEETRHGFEDGDFVTFTEVKGMVELNKCEPIPIKVVGPETFSIGDTTSFTPYLSGGICTQVKMPFKLNFKSLSESINDPEFLITDFAKMEAPLSCHIFFQSINLLGGVNTIKSSWNKSGAENFIKSTKDLIKEGKIQCDSSDFDVHLACLFYFTAKGSLIPVHSVMGGIAAQEVIKALSHRFTPIHQWLYFDCREILPENSVKLDESNQNIVHTFLPENDSIMNGDDLNKKNLSYQRYKSQFSVIGCGIQQKIANARLFIVGAGAIGCELLKNFAMMGLATGGDGKIFITDMDRIERSNLNRQFLFRNEHIGHLKSTTASKAAIQMNSHLRIEPHELKVGPDTENFYTDDFFENLDIVANALDNVEARTYVDRRCVFYHKPLLESGTLGTKGNVQVVVPYLTESYSSSQDPPEKTFQLCTLKSFPYEIAHTLQWARDAFHTHFFEAGVVAQSYCRDPIVFKEKLSSLQGNKLRETLDTLNRALIVERPQDFNDCIQWARDKFQHLYSNEIRQLLHNFPPDQKSTNGSPFWSGTKRCPHPLNFDPTDETHFNFIYSAANLQALLYGIKQCRDTKKILELVKLSKVENFVPRDGVKIMVTESEANMANNDDSSLDDARIKRIILELEKSQQELVDLPVQPIEFEKDDDSNFHMDFITSCSNLRAFNYNIEPADKLKSKLIAGKIIPAIATTTGIVAGLVCIEFLKLILGHKNIEMYKNGFLNLAIPFIAFSEPIAPAKLSYFETQFSIWDRFDINEDMTLEQFIEYFKKNFKLSIIMLSQNLSMLYSFFISKQTRDQRMKMKMPDLVEAVSKKPIPSHVKSLVFEICCNDDAGNDVDVPYVKYKISSK